jgi:CHASE1-domain containing sensor protein
MDRTQGTKPAISHWLLGTVTVAIALISVTIFELVEQNSELRNEIQIVEAAMPRLEELQRRRDAADKETATLRAEIVELKRTTAKANR